jgi:hypothetical protein
MNCPRCFWNVGVRLLCIASREILPNGLQSFEEQWQEEVIHGPSPAPISPEERATRISLPPVERIVG